MNISNSSDAPDGTTGSRSLRLRARHNPVDYSEDELEEGSKTPAKGKKRGFKRKAETNVESLYCQEKITNVCPSALETIFESPQKEKSRGRPKNGVVVRRQKDEAFKTQVMSIKKWKRFCSFADYYNPSKQKTKVRKDRAKKLKQQTGVKVPKGNISDEALHKVLAVLSEEEDQNENIPRGISYKNISSFYTGNVIRPDVEDSSLNEVIRNISAIKMDAENVDKQEGLPKSFLDGFDGHLFSTGVGNGQPPVSQQKKSRRRSDKFIGGLLSRSVKSADCESSYNRSQMSEVKEYLESNLSDLPGEKNQVPAEEMIEEKITPKRRNLLGDKKVVKKPKRQDLTRKRQSEVKDEKCQKKRGNLLENTDNSAVIRPFEDDDDHVETDYGKGEATIVQASKYSVDTTFLLPEHENTGLQNLVNSTCWSVKGKRRGKRRVSGINRPLYRTILEDQIQEKGLDNENYSPDLNISGSSPNSLNSSDVRLSEVNATYSWETSPATATTVQQEVTKMYPSPTSPCTQMAALSLQSEREGYDSHMSTGCMRMGLSKQKNRKKSIQLNSVSVSTKKTRRRSEQFNIASVALTLPPEFRAVSAALPLQHLILQNGDADSHYEKAEPDWEAKDLRKNPSKWLEISQEVQKKAGKQLLSIFSQCRDIPDVKSKYDEGARVDNSCKKNVLDSEGLLNDDASSTEARNTSCIVSRESSCVMSSGVPSSTSNIITNSQKDSVRKTDAFCSVTLQPDVEKVVRNTLENKSLNHEILEGVEGIESESSPIISGIIENRTRIRSGKIYHNNKVSSSN